MALVRMIAGTRYDGRYRPSGEELEVPPATAERWADIGLAAIVQDEAPAEPAEDVGPTDLPLGLPGRSALLREGIDYPRLLTMDEAALVAVKGIGPALARRILDTL
jgi:hypothetical protein